MMDVTANIVSPFVSIVIPTREGLSEDWLKELLKVKGNVEFILVHPPGVARIPVFDARLRQLISPLRGEIIQRINGLLNATGTYILTINCDEYLFPNIGELAANYFNKFPDSWVMRLSKKSFEFGDKSGIEAEWGELPNIDKLGICGRSQGNSKLYNEGNHLLEIPISPLDNKFDVLCFFRGRKDHHGPHTENFDKKVWENEKVQETLQEIVKFMPFFGALKYIPFWCLDRTLGLFIQAKFFEKGKIIGHLLPLPEQIRVEDNPPEFRRNMRFYLFAEIWLLRRFPQYGYLWNLIINHIREIPFTFLRAIKAQIGEQRQKIG